MGYFDALAEICFKKDSLGNTLYYPWGIFGSGVVIESNDKLEKLRQLHKKYIHFSLFTIPVIIFIILNYELWGWLSAFFIYSIENSWYYLLSKKLTYGLPRSREKLKYSETIEKQINLHSLKFLIFSEITSCIMIYLGSWVLLNTKSLYEAEYMDQFIDIGMGIVMIGAGVFVFGWSSYIIYRKLRLK